jgi:hypothetical protein
MKYLERIILNSIIIIQITSCAFKDNIETHNENEWIIVKSNIKNDKKNKFKKNEILLSEYNHSGNHNYFLTDSNIIIYDNLFHTITMFDYSGKIIKQNGGIEKTKDYEKFTRPYSFSHYSNGYVSIFGREYTLLDNDLEIKSIKKIKFLGGEQLKSILSVPNANNMTAYELNERYKNFYQISKNEIIVSIESEAPSFNPYNTLQYFIKSRPFGIVNVEKGTLAPVPITRSSLYKDKCCLTVQDASYLVKKDSLFYIQFAADSLIYVYNKDFNQKYAFGLLGKFLQNKIYNDGLDIAFDQEKYLNLEKKANLIEALFILKKDLICRIIKNNSSKEKYLQIYKGVSLIYEKEIPFTFKFIGINNTSIVGLVYDNENKNKICILSQY